MPAEGVAALDELKTIFGGEEMEKRIYQCDRPHCGALNACRLTFHADEVAEAGKVQKIYGTVDLCAECLADELQSLIYVLPAKEQRALWLRCLNRAPSLRAGNGL